MKSSYFVAVEPTEVHPSPGLLPELTIPQIQLMIYVVTIIVGLGVQVIIHRAQKGAGKDAREIITETFNSRYADFEKTFQEFNRTVDRLNITIEKAATRVEGLEVKVAELDKRLRVYESTSPLVQKIHQDKLSALTTQEEGSEKRLQRIEERQSKIDLFLSKKFPDYNP